MKYFHMIIIFSIISFSQNFIENRGQVNESVKFYAQYGHINYLIKDDGIYLDIFQKESNEIIGEVVQIKFDNPNKISIDEVNESTIYNFFKGKKAITNVKSYEYLLAEDIYDGIDIKLYSDQGNPRYDFIVHKGADPTQISFSFGEKQVQIENDKVDFNTDFSIVTSTELVGYQIINGVKKIVDCNFKNNNGKISFELGDYSKEHDLIIDPIVYSKKIGGLQADDVTELYRLNDTEYLLVGQTESADFPTTEGAYRKNIAFDQDVFISKYSQFGKTNNLVYSTFFGGNSADEIAGVEVDTDGNIIIAGTTESDDLPMVEPIQFKLNGNEEGYVVKFNPEIDEVIVSTYLGGNENDMIYDLVIDNFDNIYVAGTTVSNNFPLRTPLQDALSSTGNTDGFISILNEDMEILEYSTYLGGTSTDTLIAMDVDNQGNIYVIGHTNSGDFPTAPSGFGRTEPYDAAKAQGFDMFVAKLSEGGSNLRTSTYIGGAGQERGIDIKAAPDGGMYIVGTTTTTESSEGGLEIALTTYQDENEGGIDLFIAKLTGQVERERRIFGQTFIVRTQELENSTFLGGSNDDMAEGMYFETDLNTITIYGSTESGDFPEENEDRIEYEDGFDGFLCQLGITLGEVQFSTFAGGSEDETIKSFIKNSNGSIVYTGTSNSSDMITTDESNDTGDDAIFLQRYVSGEIDINRPTGNQIYCKNGNISINWSKQGNFDDSRYRINLIDAETEEVTVIEESYSGEKPYNWEVWPEFEGQYYMTMEHENGLFSEPTGTFTITSNPVVSKFETSKLTSNICEGENITIDLEWNGQEEIDLEWYKDDQLIDFTGATLAIDNFSINDEGEYFASLDGRCPPVAETEKLNLVLVDNTSITDQTEEQAEVSNNESITLFVDVIGAELEYQWYFNDSDILGETSSELVVENANQSNEGEYYCLVNGSCGEEVRSNKINLSVITTNVKIQNSNDLQILNHSITNDNVEIITNSIVSANCKLSILNSLGKTIYKNNKTIKKGIDKYFLPLNIFSNGSYFVLLETSNSQALININIVK